MDGFEFKRKLKPVKKNKSQYSTRKKKINSSQRNTGREYVNVNMKSRYTRRLKNIFKSYSQLILNRKNCTLA